MTAPIGAPQPADDVALVLELPLGGIRCWEQAVLLLVSVKAHPKVTMKTTGQLVSALASYADWTTGADIRPGWKRLMADVGRSRRSIAYHLGFLREMGVLTRTYHGTHLSGGTAMASVYAARIPNTALAGAAREQAITARREAERARTPATIGARHLTCPGSAVRGSRTSAAAKSTVARKIKKRGISPDPFKNCTPPPSDLDFNHSRNHLGSPATTEDKIAAKMAGARDLAEWLVSEVHQFKATPVGLVANLLRPLAAAGWTREDLAYWLGIRPLPRWYITETAGHRVFDPWPLPGRVESPFGLLAHRCGGTMWRGFEPPSVVRRRAHAAALARNAELRDAQDQDLEAAMAADAPSPAPRQARYSKLPGPRRSEPQRPAPTPAWLTRVRAAAAAAGEPARGEPGRPEATLAERLAQRASRWLGEGKLTDDNAAADR